MPARARRNRTLFLADDLWTKLERDYLTARMRTEGRLTKHEFVEDVITRGLATLARSGRASAVAPPAPPIAAEATTSAPPAPKLRPASRRADIVQRLMQDTALPSPVHLPSAAPEEPASALPETASHEDHHGQS